MYIYSSKNLQIWVEFERKISAWKQKKKEIIHKLKNWPNVIYQNVSDYIIYLDCANLINLAEAKLLKRWEFAGHVLWVDNFIYRESVM